MPAGPARWVSGKWLPALAHGGVRRPTCSRARQAREAIHQNPAGALAPVPMAHLPHLWLALDRQTSREVRPPRAPCRSQLLGRPRARRRVSASTLRGRGGMRSGTPCHQAAQLVHTHSWGECTCAQQGQCLGQAGAARLNWSLLTEPGVGGATGA